MEEFEMDVNAFSVLASCREQAALGSLSFIAARNADSILKCLPASVSVWSDICCQNELIIELYNPFFVDLGACCLALHLVLTSSFTW
jgi:hypothetical protein